MKKHFKQQLDTLGEALALFDDAAAQRLMDDCLRAIRGGKSVIATALGKNVPMCEKFVGTLNSLSIDAHFMHTNSAIHGDLGMVAEGDVVIVLSKSGETEETVHLAQLLNERGTSNWLLTCVPNSSAGKIIGNEVVFPIRHEGDPWNLVPNNSSMVFLIFLQALSMEIIDAIPVSLEKFKRNHPGGAIGKTLKNHGKA